ncbi:Cupin 2, conserved barrel [Seminavis robusta]|uniref:Cupin 2, conserved barrel n=1 Tax=Seminavis robusta TaxID=568900 RepID=A0A9N8EPW1_9STRA|nr:Cupin 2, conserved barrel [Seminavis robusta]|eukprot:Sro1360_g266140.1 Cupin 2, conserved barrel (284) ;mRNA; f:28321-29172
MSLTFATTFLAYFAIMSSFAVGLDVTADDVLVRKGEAEKTSADMEIVFRNGLLSGHASIMEGVVRPGELLGFHMHENEDQSMFIIEGELEIEIGGADGFRFHAGPGDHILKPRNISHGFWNEGCTTARYIEISTEDGFEQFIDSRDGGLPNMIETGLSLGVTFQTSRSTEVMKECELVGLAGINLGDMDLGVLSELPRPGEVPIPPPGDVTTTLPLILYLSSVDFNSSKYAQCDANASVTVDTAVLSKSAADTMRDTKITSGSVMTNSFLAYFGAVVFGYMAF